MLYKIKRIAKWGRRAEAAQRPNYANVLCIDAEIDNSACLFNMRFIMLMAIGGRGWWRT